jgi:hypothetical protein
MTMLSRLARIIGLLGLAAVLASCSTIKLGYSNLDDIAYWWLDSYVDFSDDQATRVREDLQRLHRWHRTEELPRIGALLARMEQVAPNNISPEQACAFVPPIRERLAAVSARAEPAVVTLAMGLSPEQLIHLEKKYAKNDAEFRKDWMRITPAKLKEKRLKQFRERSEMIYGPLEEAQVAVLERQLEKSAFDPRRLLALREHRQQDILSTLRKVAGRPIEIAEARLLMHGVMERSQSPVDPAHKAYSDLLLAEACSNFSAVHNATTPAQRETARRRLQAWQRDTRDLASPQ